MKDVRLILSQYAPLLPCVLGLACARVGMVIATPAGHAYEESGLSSDAALVAGICIVAIAMLVVFKTRCVFPKRFVNATIHFSVAVQVVGTCVLAAFSSIFAAPFSVHFALSVIVTLASLLSVAYWLRRVRGASMSTAVVVVFGALAASEVAVFAASFLNEAARYLFSVPFVAAQIACVRAARKRPNAYVLETPTRSDDYFSFMRKGAANARFLATCAVGLCALSFVGGFLCGFPDGHAAVKTAPSHAINFMLVEVICFALIAATLHQRSRVMTVGIWVLLELLAALSLVVYSSSHGNVEYGAIFATTLSTIMLGFVWYLIIAFMSYGWRDPFYYAMGLWLVWTASHVVGRFVPFLAGPVGPLAGDSHLMGTVISLLILISAQVVLVKLIDVAKFAYEEESARLAEQYGLPAEENASVSCEVEVAPHDDRASETPFVRRKSGALEKLLGIDNDAAVSDVRDAATRHGAEEVGRQFMLSEREIEVLALYMSGLTQKRVAEELSISQTTAHTHIGRIYAKTGMHSRQEILDYVRNHVD